jgi:hypothetical protein
MTVRVGVMGISSMISKLLGPSELGNVVAGEPAAQVRQTRRGSTRLEHHETTGAFSKNRIRHRKQ